MSLHASRAGRIVGTAAKILIPLALLAGSLMVARTFILARPEPERQEREDRGLLVEVVRVEEASHRLDVLAEGTVVAARQVVLVPQVTGRVTWLSENLTQGGLVGAEEELLRIEDRDYRLNLDMRRAELERARAALELEEGRQVVARREWEMFADEVPDDPRGRALATREPQLRDVRQTIELAETGVARARLDLQRTTLSAPFNAYVEEEGVEVGQLIGPSSRVATLVGTDEYWVLALIPVARLEHIDIPGVNAAEGSRARIWQELGSGRVEREGWVIRLLPSLDPVGRLARVLVAVEDPLRLAQPPEERGLPLLVGSFVHLEILGNHTQRLIEVPRAALREGGHVFVMTPEHTLDIRDVEIVWGLPASVLVRSGLRDGEALITSRVGTAVPGMRLRTPGQASGEGTGAAGSADAGGGE
jgi:RND family efflux transporter MFP subunit